MAYRGKERVAGPLVTAPSGVKWLPWLGQTLVGTTDNDYDGPLDHVSPSARDIAYLLDAVNSFFGTGLATEDVTPTQEVMGLEAVPAKEAGEIVEADDETPGKVVEFLKSAKVI